MLADVHSEDGGWLNTLNSSEESDKVTIPSGFSSSSLSLSSSSSLGTGWDDDAPTEGIPTKSG